MSRQKVRIESDGNTVKVTDAATGTIIGGVREVRFTALAGDVPQAELVVLMPSTEVTVNVDRITRLCPYCHSTEDDKLTQILEEHGPLFQRNWLRNLRLIVWDAEDLKNPGRRPCNTTMQRWQQDVLLATATKHQKMQALSQTLEQENGNAGWSDRRAEDSGRTDAASKHPSEPHRG